jgi:hypothetical protein
MGRDAADHSHSHSTRSYCTEPHRTNRNPPPNLTGLDRTRPMRAKDGQASPKQQRFDDETPVAVFPACLRTTSIGATASELKWRRSDGTIAQCKSDLFG